MARKTIAVEDVKRSVNHALSTVAEGNDPQYRNGLAAVLEDVLMKTGNYKGFRFTDGQAGRHDHTRRFYF